MISFEQYRDEFRPLYDAVKRAHHASPHKHRGHGIDHDVTVAQMAAYLSDTPGLARTGWVAGLIHSADRVVGKEAFPSKLREYLSELPKECFTPAEIEEIYLAALEHDKKIAPHQTPTQAVLQDADKLVNMQSMVVIRSGQFHPDMTALEFDHLTKMNPQSTYHLPKSVFDALRILPLEYPDMLVTPKAKELSRVYGVRLERYAEHVFEDHEMLGLVDVKL